MTMKRKPISFDIFIKKIIVILMVIKAYRCLMRWVSGKRTISPPFVPTWPEASLGLIWRREREPWQSVSLTKAVRLGHLGAPFSLLCPTLSLFVPQKQEETNSSSESESEASPVDTVKQNFNEEDSSATAVMSNIQTRLNRLTVADHLLTGAQRSCWN